MQLKLLKTFQSSKNKTFLPQTHLKLLNKTKTCINNLIKEFCTVLHSIINKRSFNLTTIDVGNYNLSNCWWKIFNIYMFAMHICPAQLVELNLHIVYRVNKLIDHRSVW